MQQNDILIYYAGRDGSTTLNVPTGFTNLGGTNNAQMAFGIAWKRMGATPDSTISGLTSAIAISHTAVAIRGASTGASPIIAATPSSGSTGSPNPPSVTSTSNNSLILAFGFLDDDTLTSVTPPSGFTDIFWHSVDESGACSGTMASYLVQTSAGSIDPSSYTTNGDDAWYGITLAINPS
jgi:hypothetical protein